VHQQTTTASTSTADLPLNSTSTRFNTTQQIPHHEQDLDANRHQPIPEDGADVVNLLSEPGLPGGEPSTPLSLAPEPDSSNLNFTDDVGTSPPFLPLAQPPSSAPAPTSLSTMLYGPNSALSV
jgi:hypothetical protein